MGRRVQVLRFWGVLCTAMSALCLSTLASCSKDKGASRGAANATETGLASSATWESSTPRTNPSKEEGERCGFPGMGAGTTPEPGDTDQVYGQTVAAAESFRVVGGRVFDRGQEIALKGVNWFGLETPALAPHGLWAGYTRRDFLQRIVDLKFNAVRLPLAPEAIEPSNFSASWAVDGDVDTGREHLERVLADTLDLGLYVLLDIHTCSAYSGSSVGDPFECPGYDQQRWLDNLASLAELAADYPNVVGIDLFNEPHLLTWSDWRQLVAVGAERVLRTNPHILVFVEGVGSASYAGEYQAFWGENLCLAGRQPVAVPPRRLVYSPHVYGPSVAQHSYFEPPSFPSGLSAVWETKFGYLADGEAALAIGEFGAPHVGDNAVWQTAFVDYLVERDIQHFFYWSLNPNSKDTGGLLLDDWWTLDEEKYQALLPLLER